MQKKNPLPGKPHEAVEAELKALLMSSLRDIGEDEDSKSFKRRMARAIKGEGDASLCC